MVMHLAVAYMIRHGHKTTILKEKLLAEVETKMFFSGIIL